MKKSNFAAMILGTVGGVLFALGMCMALLPEWNAFKPGIIFGCTGIIIGIIAIIVWRKMEKKAPLKFNAKAVLAVLLGIAGAIIFGTGMCFTMVWNNMVIGIITGLIGILLLLCLIPLCKGLK